MTMTRPAKGLHFGADVVQMLLPHRCPLLLVDVVDDFDFGPPVQLRSHRQISANESVFVGHFPDMKLWPGAYTLEGLAQSINLLVILETVRRRWVDGGRPWSEVVHAIRGVDLMRRRQPGGTAEHLRLLEDALGPVEARMGVMAACNVKFVAPVFAGDRLDYVVSLGRAAAGMQICDGEAAVEGRTVARGAITIVAGGRGL